MSPETGTRLDVVVTKWGGLPHWEFAATYLGSDAHGHWLGVPVGTAFRRPGAAYSAPNPQVTLLPREGGWVATFHGPGGTTWVELEGGEIEVYVDITTPPDVDGTTVRFVDLDLDVVRGDNGVVMVDDEDEFAAHRVSLAYPDGVVRSAEESCAAVLAAVTSRSPPFDGTASGVWMDRVPAP